jgi:chorismate mutase/prephenate dehydrogenase
MKPKSAPTSALRKTSAPVDEETQRELEGLRGEIDALDEQLVNLLAQRHSKVQKVVALKQAKHLPVYHPAREENLISQRRQQARRIGLDPDHIEELYRSIIRQSRVRQTVHITRTGVRPGAKVLLVGGRGQMGHYFGHWFAASGYEVRTLDVDDWPRVRVLCDGVDLAVLSVPIHLTPPIAGQIGPHLPRQCILADITSVKKGPVAAMLAAHAGPVIGLHPLFGPTTSSMDKQVVIATPGRQLEDCQWFLDQLTTWGNIVLSLDAAEHDDIMAIVQGVRHFATFAFGQFLYRRNIDLARTLEFSSPIYRLELGMVGRFFAQDALLYADIILASPERRAVLKDFLASLADNRKILEQGDRREFCAQYEKIAEWFGPFCEQSLRESSFLIDKLVERF